MSLIYDFHGGIHPAEFKSISNKLPIVCAPLAKRFYIPLTQSIGSASIPCVKVGDKVFKGQQIARANGNISVAVHAPSSGIILAIEEYPFAHPSSINDLNIIIESDGKDQWIERKVIDNWRSLELWQIADYLREMGVVGLGGAIFPTHLKVAKQPLDTLVINGAECEPFITCDDRLMRERAEQIIDGVKILAHILRAGRVAIGVEDNKPEAIAALQNACIDSYFEVVPIPTKYPSGGAKQLIRILTGKEVPHGVRSTDYGVQCFNVGTAYSIHRAINYGEPLISRVVTLTGAVKTPQNIEVLIGTPISDILKFVNDGILPGEQEVIMGGPMMGFILPNLSSGVHKATNCLIVKSEKLFPMSEPARACIRCGECASVCPSRLQPMDLYAFAKAKQFGKAQERHLFDCIECGSCSYVCPSKIPLVDFYLYAKSEIWASEREKKAADLARKRHEIRLMRQELEQKEKAQRLAAKSLSSKLLAEVKPLVNENQVNSTETDSIKNQKIPEKIDDEKRAVIQAAMKRAADKKAELLIEAKANLEKAKPLPELSEEKRALIQAAMQRAAAKKAELLATEIKTTTEINSTKQNRDS